MVLQDMVVNLWMYYIQNYVFTFFVLLCFLGYLFDNFAFLSDSLLVLSLVLYFHFVGRIPNRLNYIRVRNV